MRVIARWGVALLFLLAISTSAVSASTVTGTIYLNVPASGDASNINNYSSSLARADFTVGPLGINFTSPPNAFTPAGFLNNPVFTNQQNGFNPNGSILNMALLLTGQVYLNSGNNSFVVGHDDGVVLDITGIGNVVNAPGPTGFTNTPFNVVAPSAGLYDFTLKYTECCSPPADLLWEINDQPVGTVPEPSVLLMMGSGLFGLGVTMRKRFRR